MKYKVLAYTFLIPLLWLTILLLRFTVPGFEIPRLFSPAILIGLFIGSFAARFFLNSKYLTSLLINDKKLLLTYLTPLARQYEVTIHLSTITNITVRKKIFLVRDFSSITFFSKDNKIKFHLLNSDVKQAAEQLLQTSFTNESPPAASKQ